MYYPLVKVIGITSLLIISLIGWFVKKKAFLLVISIGLFFLLLFTFYFFRNPERQIPDGKNIVISPADGKVVEVKTAQQLQPFDKEFTKVSLYLSLWNVHVNWIPASGEIIFLEYKKGKCYPAFQNRASKLNESNLLGIRADQGDIFVKQIAGLIARRIICTVTEGDTVTIGQKFGMIKFGSRVELFLPASIELTISPGDRVRGGETIIGKFNEK